MNKRQIRFEMISRNIALFPVTSLLPLVDKPIGGGIYLLYPYKILRYSPLLLSIIHIRYCVIGLFHSSLSLLTQSSINISLPLPPILIPLIYICSIFHTILCKYSAHLSPLSIYLSCVIYLSYLSPYLLSNIYYIYNKYLIYLSLPYILYTHDHICSIFIVDYVIIHLISND